MNNAENIPREGFTRRKWEGYNNMDNYHMLGVEGNPDMMSEVRGRIIEEEGRQEMSREERVG